MIIEHIRQVLEKHQGDKPAIKIWYIKEVLHYYILSHIYEQPYAKQIWFYGGTAIRILHGLDRLSEDLDFVGIWFDQYEQLGESLVQFFTSHGLNVSMKTKYFRITLKFHDILEQFGLMFDRSAMLLLKLEISDHFEFAHDYQIVPFVVRRYGTETIIHSFPIADLMGTKLNAVLYRKRSHETRGVSFKWRDYYDLYRYLSQRVTPSLWTIDGVDSYEKLKQLLTEKITELDIDQACLDVENFIESDRAIKDFREYAKEFMIRQIATW
jgi:predicted nucleotidyltransferase component of viral defense system